MTTAAPFKKVGPAHARRDEQPPVAIPRELAVWLVIRLAKMLRGGYELGVNDGPLVRLFQRVTGTQPGSAWCASFTAFLLFLLGAVCPMPPLAYCPSIAEWAKAQQLGDTRPEVGDLLLFWRHVPGEKRWRYAHVALVIAVKADGTVVTLEGNTDDDGGREGWVIARKERRVAVRDLCVHWHHKLPAAGVT